MADELTAMVNQYLATAAWAENDEEGNPFDDQPVEWSDDAIAEAQTVCAAFLLAWAERLQPISYYRSTSDVGHDLWLTRNRHGAGFWDGDYPKALGLELTAYAHTLGERNVYRNESGLLEFE